MPPELPVTLPHWGWAAVATLMLVLGLWLGRRWTSWRAVADGRRRERLGRRGERTALRLLQRAGYRVLDTQVPGRMRLRVDGRERDFVVRADALVQRRRRRYVAEFKAGWVSSRVEYRQTRRQLIEYALAYDVDGVLLVDAVRDRIVRVQL